MADVTVLGDINVDLLTTPIMNYPGRDRQITTDKIELNPGGSSFNVALACSRLGIKTRFIGKIGNDIFGNYLLKVIKDNRIDAKIKVANGEKTGITFATSFKDKTRSFITFKGTNNTLSLNDFKLSDINGKILAISGFNLLNGLRKDATKIIDYAKSRNMQVGIDPNWDPDGWGEQKINDIYSIMNRIDWFLPDITEGEAMTYTRNDVLMVKKMINLGAKTICLKEDGKGCLLGTESFIKLIPSFNVNSINTTGAGDVFFAAFIKGQLSKYSVENTIAFANAAAALSTTKFGLERYPTEKEVKDFIGNRYEL